ncbi:MAG TPA: tRNA (N(6)-L-threonylcarbamoyladenosine(37)-C(2))-methylthiotransferase MtaB, partial [Lentisphaeria bacterium]|nr:tRNA (N(6)-L-threonylcarbamoyladenosine(37)-C(2))-methylthiotransferase MtaB [Lentisphaeria bacterium]
MPNVAFYTLGCRLNQAETGLAAADLASHGYTLAPWGAPADLLVINSCAVTSVAAQKTRQAVRAARRRWPAAFLVVIG